MKQIYPAIAVGSGLFFLSACAVLEASVPASREASERTGSRAGAVGEVRDEEELTVVHLDDDPVGEIAADAAPAAVVPAPSSGSSRPEVPARPAKRATEIEEASEAPAPAPRRARQPRRSGVQAGASDDNLQFHAFLDFVRENAQLGLPFNVDDRVVLKVVDADGKPVPDAHVGLGGQNRRTTYADGRALLHPRRWGLQGRQLDLQVEGLGVTARAHLGAARGRHLEVRLDARRVNYQGVPMDIAFVLDTTGSMGDELARLRETFDAITYQVSQLHPRPQVRFGTVLYRDRGDAYVTRTIPFTEDVQAFARALASVSAGGGGDTPEDVQEGLRVAMKELQWRTKGVRLAFLVGDASPHLDYGQSYTYVDALEEAARRGIKITTVGASGLDRRGELIWRQIAQATTAPFVFLTYGETGDSEGSASSVSHHVGSNWTAAPLDAIIVRMVKQELAHYGDRPPSRREDWFSAAPSSSASVEEVLEELFDRSTRQLVDYAVEPLEARTPTVLFPIAGEGGAGVERLHRRLALGLARKPQFQLLETDARSELLSEVSRQMRMGYDESKMVNVGRLVPAKLAVLGQLDGGPGEREMLLKLVRLETGEILSLSLLKIDRRLL